MAGKKTGSGPVRDPFDDDDGGVRDADEAAIQRMKQRVEAADVTTSAEDIEELPIGGSLEADDDAETAEERQSRRERRRNRYREVQEENADLKSRLGRLEELASRYPDPNAIAQQVQQNMQPGRDPMQEELENIRREQEQLAEVYHSRRSAGTLTPDQERDMRKRAQELDDKRVDVIAERKVRQRTPPQGVNDQQVVLATLRTQNGDVVNHPKASVYASGVYQQLIAQGWEQSIDTANEAFERAREAFQMPSKGRRREPAPTPSQRERYSSTPAGASGAAARGEKPSTIKITPEIRIMADAAFSHIKDPRARLQKWVNGPGKRIVEQGR